MKSWKKIPCRKILKLIRDDVIALGIFCLPAWIAEPAQADSVENKYRLDSMH
jgi:hypothetical protein